MATFREIQTYVGFKNGFVPHTCWIAEVEELMPYSSSKRGMQPVRQRKRKKQSLS